MHCLICGEPLEYPKLQYCSTACKRRAAYLAKLAMAAERRQKGKYEEGPAA